MMISSFLWISIHALLAESDTCNQMCNRCPSISIHALLAESDQRFAGFLWCFAYFYPRSPCGERPVLRHNVRQLELISIHALLAESDCHRIHSIRLVLLFLSTLSLRRATGQAASRLAPKLYFYPRSPCGERRASNHQGQLKQHISIHALLAESDSKSAQNSGALLRI